MSLGFLYIALKKILYYTYKSKIKRPKNLRTENRTLLQFSVP